MTHLWHLACLKITHLLLSDARELRMDVHFCGKLPINRGVNCCLKHKFYGSLNFPHQRFLKCIAHHINFYNSRNKIFALLSKIYFQCDSHFDTKRQKKDIKSRKFKDFLLINLKITRTIDLRIIELSLSMSARVHNPVCRIAV